MKLVATACCVGILFALGACSHSKEPAVSEATPPTQPAQKTVFDTQLKALDKAKAVQGVVDQQKVDADRKVKEQEEGGG
ncbi:MAG TPA: hypothetical protein VFE67_08330 [Rudaea sp.]|jgi:hypothetical protein|nr:hypothetical protein [Rudaea sp.]